MGGRGGRGTCQALVLSNFKTFLSRRCERPLIWVRGCSLIRLRFCSLEGLPVQCLPWLLALPSRRFLIFHYLPWPSVGDYVLLRTYTAFSAHPLPKESQRSQDFLKSWRTSGSLFLWQYNFVKQQVSYLFYSCHLYVIVNLCSYSWGTVLSTAVSLAFWSHTSFPHLMGGILSLWDFVGEHTLMLFTLSHFIQLQYWPQLMWEGKTNKDSGNQLLNAPLWWNTNDFHSFVSWSKQVTWTCQTSREQINCSYVGKEGEPNQIVNSMECLTPRWKM